MTDCHIQFTREENQFAYDLYQALPLENVPCEDRDEPSEIITYALDRYDQYQKLIEGTLGQSLPWVLDDLDPETPFDEMIRRMLTEDIQRLEQILEKQGIEKGTETYQEKMAVGLFYLVSLPNAQWIRRNKLKFEEMSQELKDIGLEEYRSYLRKKGGLLPPGDHSKEYTALEALENNQGECTEQSNILFSIFKMAGLSPEIVSVDRNALRSNSPKLAEYLQGTSIGMTHVCLGLQIGKRFRLFDVALHDSNATYTPIDRLTLRQHLAWYFSARASSKSNPDQAIEDYTLALSIDSDNANLYLGLGIAYLHKGERDKALSYFHQASAIDPENYLTHYNLGIFWHKGEDDDQALSAFTRAIELAPEESATYDWRGLIWFQKDEYDKAIADYDAALVRNPNDVDIYYHRALVWDAKEEFDAAIADYDIILKIDPRYGPAYGRLGLLFVLKGELADAIQAFAAFLKLVPQENDTDFYDLIIRYALFRWERQDDLQTIAQIFSKETGGLDIVGAEALFILSYSFWTAGDQARAIHRLASIEVSLEFHQTPSQQIRDFFGAMFALMPKSMAVNKTVQAIRKAIKEKTL